jgi:hypothetical protein
LGNFRDRILKKQPEIVMTKIHPTHDCAPWLYRFGLCREAEPKNPQSSSPDASQEQRLTRSEPFSFHDAQTHPKRAASRNEPFSFRDAQSLPKRAASRVMGDPAERG